MSKTTRTTTRLRCECLEARDVPATLYATTANELIACIAQANVSYQADTIVLTSGAVYSLTTADNTTFGATGLPVVAAAGGPLTIVGNGATIERSVVAGTPSFRLLAVETGAALTAENLTLQGGRAYGAYGWGVAAQGGAIRTDGTLNLSAVIVRNNEAVGGAGRNGGAGHLGAYSGQNGGDGLGGGIYVGGGTANLTGVTLTGNAARGGTGGNGIKIKSPGRGLPAVGLAGNGGDGLGGGVYAAGGVTTLYGTSVTGNTAIGGAGGAKNGAPSNGVAGQGKGGGAYVEADATFTPDAFSFVTGNTASTSGTDPNIYRG